VPTDGYAPWAVIAPDAGQRRLDRADRCPGQRQGPEPGGYTFGDLAKVGLPLLLSTMLVTVALVAVIYPVSGT